MLRARYCAVAVQRVGGTKAETGAGIADELAKLITMRPLAPRHSGKGVCFVGTGTVALTLNVVGMHEAALVLRWA